MKTRLIAVGAVLGLAMAPVAMAGEWTSAGKGMGKSGAQIHQVAEGHLLMDLHTDYVGFEFDEADHPMAGMTGPCFGAAEFKAGVMTGGGRCLYTDAAGESVSMNWTPTALTAEGAMIGTWNITGGTGKWASASGGGTFHSLTNPETGESVNTVRGVTMLP